MLKLSFEDFEIEFELRDTDMLSRDYFEPPLSESVLSCLIFRPSILLVGNNCFGIFAPTRVCYYYT